MGTRHYDLSKNTQDGLRIFLTGDEMSLEIDTLFTSALDLQGDLWNIQKAALDTSRRRIDYDPSCNTSRLFCTQYAAPTRGVDDRLTHAWRYLATEYTEWRYR